MTAFLRKFRPQSNRCTWENVDVKNYKPEGTHFREITRQILFEEGLPAQMRYFEIGPGGYSSFEKHEHVHAVMILHGAGKALVSEEVFDVAPYDLIYVPPLTWHQFYAGDDLPLGFLCLVDCQRDSPVRPSAEERESLSRRPALKGIVRF